MTSFGIRFRPPLVWCLVTALVVSCFVGLGLWQYRRGEQKAAWEANYGHRVAAAPVSLVAALDEDDWRYVRVRLQGHFDNAHTLLLDNQLRDGRPGVFVMTPFVPHDGGEAVLVNRGWLAWTGGRERLPSPPPATGTTVTGLLYPWPGPALQMGTAASTDGWPRLVNYLDAAQLAAWFDTPLAPVAVFQQSAADDLLRDWAPAFRTTPQRHLGYAIQWWAMALAVMVIFVVVNSRRER